MKITIAGLGPGEAAGLTGKARQALLDCDLVVGYDLYVDQIRHLAAGREFISTGMRREADRCRMALSAALAGRKVCLVCSGDAGVYGLAGLMLEVAAGHPEVSVEVVPGVTAACSASAALGAPLGHDFAVISLSDLLTPWETIARRISLAAEADLIICLYNPRSRKRVEHLERAAALMMRHKRDDTPCGCVRNVGREGESAWICSLAELPDQDIDMFTTVIVGNSQTKIINGRLVTPRGYQGVSE